MRLLPALAWVAAASSTALAVTAEAQRTAPSAARAFAVEALGGSLGSALGAGVGVAVSQAVAGKCDAEDLSCILRLLATAGVTSSIGAATGAYVAGRRSDTGPSLGGAALGAVAGALAGAGAVKLLDEGGISNGAASLFAYSITQGALTALGSRLLARRPGAQR